jgi:uncharacterized protein (DUF305 family)
VTRTWSRIGALVAAAFVGAVTVFCLTPGPRSVSPPLTATDVGFAQDMSAHHHQAVVMSDMVAADAAPEIRALADQIKFSQLREIGQMTGWLQIADAPVVSPHPMAWMMTDADHHMAGGEMAMPGMASPADLTRLQRATGRANEILFLQLMTRHHQGGIDMAGYAVQHTTTKAVHQTAVAMTDEQSQEIILMAHLLEQRGSAPLAYP